MGEYIDLSLTFLDKKIFMEIGIESILEINRFDETIMFKIRKMCLENFGENY